MRRGTSGVVSSQSDNNGGRVGQSDLLSESRPAARGRTLQMKEREDAAEETFDGTAFA